MFARVTPFQMKPDRIADARAMVVSVKDQIMALPGMLEFYNVMNDDGSGYVISMNESQATSEGNADQVRKIWSNFGDLLAAPPVGQGYHVEHHWKT